MYDFDKVIDRNNTNSIKWDRQTRAFGMEGLLPFWIADTDFAVAPGIQAALAERVQHPIYGYACAGAHYTKALVDWFDRRHGWKIEPEWVLPSIGVVPSIGFAMDAVTQPGDKVLVLTPIYDPFFGMIQSTGRVLVTCDLVREGNSYRVDFEALERELRGGVRALIFCNPHNPVGKVWTRDELKTIAELCAKYRVYLLSDDIHCDMLMKQNRYTPLASFDCVKDLCVTFTAPSKTFNVAGAGISNIIAEDAALRGKVHAAMLSKFIMGASLFGYVICEAAYTCAEDWLDELREYLYGNYEYVADYCKEHLPEVGVTELQGTFLMWLDFRCLGMDSAALCKLMSTEYGIALNRGNAFGKCGDGFMRFNIGCSRATLQQAMEKLSELYYKYGGRANG